MGEELVKVSTYAKMIGVTPVYVYKLIKDKKVKTKVIDGVVFIVKEE